jgi:hypothetical protein
MAITYNIGSGQYPNGINITLNFDGNSSSVNIPMVSQIYNFPLILLASALDPMAGTVTIGGTQYSYSASLTVTGITISFSQNNSPVNPPAAVKTFTFNVYYSGN